MSQIPATVLYNGQVRAVVRVIDDFGFRTFDLAAPPRRLFASSGAVPLVEQGVDARHVTPAPSLANLLQTSPEGESWLSVTHRTLARVWTAFLVGEDPQRRLDAQKAATLMHQLSLVQHVLETSSLRRVLIADEVGLGKTIEAGLIIKRITDENPRLRVLYLAPARLVSNVAFEFRDKLDLNARCWVAGNAADARLGDDRLVVASIHKAVFGDNLKKVVESGPWDVLIVDECHHLSDWDWEGGSANRSFNLVKQLAQSLPSSGRLILMSGTPHQGSEARFRNLLRLLSDDGRTLQSASGRVIFRTKDRVRDWRNQPLFPSRDVRPPRIVQLGPEYAAWYEQVASLYDNPGASGARARASGWAKGQALQWVASSVQAGLGFLVRLAIRRLHWSPTNSALSNAISALRPYRGGRADEPVNALYERLKKQVGAQLASEDILGDDEILDEDEAWKPDAGLLASLLARGVSLLGSPAASANWDALLPLIHEAGSEKIVFFAQPVETVSVVARFLENKFGEAPCIIIGDQSEEDRRAQVAAFQSDAGPRFLVSSRAGGEGLNMQKARRLIHLDVPWNPMEMEQRIGRVHRFGSRKTIIVDTIVAAGSREVDMYQAAREKLKLISRQMDPEQFENLFSRVMALVPPAELEGVLSAAISDNDISNEIGELVRRGYEAWQSFDDEYRKNADQIQSLAGGEATWSDLCNFLSRYAGATPNTDAVRTVFAFENGEVFAKEESIPTLSLNGVLYACGDSGGVLPSHSSGENILQLGLNIEPVATAIREMFLPEKRAGAAFVSRAGMPAAGFKDVVGLLFFLNQSLRFGGDRPTEDKLSFHTYLVGGDGSTREASSSEAATIVRWLSETSRTREPPTTVDMRPLEAAEQKLIAALRTPSDQQVEDRVRNVVWPVASIVIH